MKVLEQINTFAQAKRLKQTGLRVKGRFVFRFQHLLSAHKPMYMNDEYYPFWDLDLPAYTVAELGEMMRELQDYFTESHYDRYKKVWLCSLWKLDENDRTGSHVLVYETFGFSEAEARTDMLLYLLHENLLTVPQINLQMKL